jgi:hypothetical protein
VPDPLKEPFHLPAAAIKLGGREGRQREVVGQEGKRLARGRIEPMRDQQKNTEKPSLNSLVL